MSRRRQRSGPKGRQVCAGCSAGAGTARDRCARGLAQVQTGARRGQVAGAGAAEASPSAGPTARGPRQPSHTDRPPAAGPPPAGSPHLALTQPGALGPAQKPAGGRAAKPSRFGGRSGSELRLPSGGREGRERGGASRPRSCACAEPPGRVLRSGFWKTPGGREGEGHLWVGAEREDGKRGEELGGRGGRKRRL